MITIKKIRNQKTINGQTLETILGGLDSNFDPSLVKSIFHKIESEEDLMEELGKIIGDNTPTKVLLYIRHLTNLPMKEATDILHELLGDLPSD